MRVLMLLFSFALFLSLEITSQLNAMRYHITEEQFYTDDDTDSWHEMREMVMSYCEKARFGLTFLSSLPGFMCLNCKLEDGAWCTIAPLIAPYVFYKVAQLIQGKSVRYRDYVLKILVPQTIGLYLFSLGFMPDNAACPGA